MAALLTACAGCARQDAPAANSSQVTLTVAFGLATGSSPESGAQQAVGNMTRESLIGFTREGRPQARLAESWSTSDDGLTVRVHLRAGATFHDGKAVTGEEVRNIVAGQLKDYLGPAFADIDSIRVTSPLDVEFTLKRRSAYILEALDIGIASTGSGAGTGPFKVVDVTSSGAEVVANERYYGGKPLIEKIQIKPYGSVRAAWADMLRGQVDMLYEVGTDALDLLEPSKNIRVVINQRNYAYMLILNVERPALRDPDIRRALNAAIDRQSLVSEILKGHGTPAVGSVWPHHWAYDSQGPEFRFEPRLTKPIRFTCVFGEAAQERLALAVQKQLHAVGVDLDLELMPLDQAVSRVRAGNFDAFLGDFQLGPTLLQAYRFWHTNAPRAWGHFSSAPVDAAFDQIRDSSSEDAYRSGVAAFQRAVFNDPPAIFLAWSERARAVSTRFEVPVEPGRDILGTLRLWRPTTTQMASRN